MQHIPKAIYVLEVILVPEEAQDLEVMVVLEVTQILKEALVPKGTQNSCSKKNL